MSGRFRPEDLEGTTANDDDHSVPVIGVVASAGGVEALSHFVAALPNDLPAAVLVVLHVSPTGSSVLPEILARAGKLPARHAVDGQVAEAGTVLVAPPDRHLTVSEGHLHTEAGPRHNGQRPSADVLLVSIARDCGPNGAGVVLTGTMDDGAAGLRAVGAAGGLTLVQDPKEAAFPSMPRAAIETAQPDLVGSVTDLAEKAAQWAVDRLSARVLGGAAKLDEPADDPPDALSPFTCPECGGLLRWDEQYGARQLRCRVGHVFSERSLLRGKKEALEAALWAAVVALEEQVDLFRRTINRLAANAALDRHVQRYERRIRWSNGQIAVLRGVIDELTGGVDDLEEDEGADA